MGAIAGRRDQSFKGFAIRWPELACSRMMSGEEEGLERHAAILAPRVSQRPPTLARQHYLRQPAAGCGNLCCVLYMAVYY